jgi:hypothetical protein
MPFDAINPKYGNIAISTYGYMASRMANMGVAGKSNKNAAICPRN